MKALTRSDWKAIETALAKKNPVATTKSSSPLVLDSSGPEETPEPTSPYLPNPLNLAALGSSHPEKIPASPGKTSTPIASPEEVARHLSPDLFRTRPVPRVETPWSGPRQMDPGLFAKRPPEMVDREIKSNPPLPYGGGLFGHPCTAGELLARPVPPLRVVARAGRPGRAALPSTPPVDPIEVTTNYQPSLSPPSQPNRNNYSAFSDSAEEPKSVSPDAVWVPCGRTVQYAGYSIPGGLIYFGSGLQSVRGWGEEPSLIDPSLPFDNSNPDREGKNMGYWSSYSQIHPTSRAAFLEWLSTGRNDPKTCIGYVLLYFHGLERRALADTKDSASARNDLPAIMTEVNRLLSIYWGNGSFHEYASQFLDALRVSQAYEPLYRTPPQFEYYSSYEVPITLKVALGQMATDGVPLSAEWALAWADNDPSKPRRIPAQRCLEEFRELFRIRYGEKFGEGLKLKPNKARIRATYYPASASFGGHIEIPLPDLPDLTQTSEPLSKISELVAACTDELEGYSRYLGQSPDAKDSIEAASYLPQVLLKGQAGKDFQGLSTWLNSTLSSEAPVPISFSSLLQHLSSLKQEGFGKREATIIANLLAKMNVGIEPDPRFGTFVPKPDQDVVLFRMGSNAPNSPSAEYSAAAVVLHLASAVASVDGSVNASEERHLEHQLEKWLHLAIDEKTRLRRIPSGLSPPFQV